jgi:broad specificity phosphatase PhoE
MYTAAVWAHGYSASGMHHGEAFGNLSWEDRLAADICSGHLNEDGTFTTEMGHLNKNIIIVRHGESEYNAEVTQDLDSCLTNKGCSQAEAAAFFLRNEILNISEYKGYVSPLLRCLQTAEYFRNILGINFQITSKVSEFTTFYPETGISVPNRSNYYPHFDWSESEFFHFPKEGDDVFLSRLKDIFAVLPDNVLLITHGTVVMTLCEMALGMNVTEIPQWDNSIANASICFIKDGTVVWFGKKITDF